MAKLMLSWKLEIVDIAFLMFLTFDRCHPINDTDANKELFINCLGALQKQFSLYFKDTDVWKCEWVRNPFATNNVSGLTTWATYIHILWWFLKYADKISQFLVPVKKHSTSFWIFCCCSDENKVSIVDDNRKETRSSYFINDTIIW